MNTTTIQNKRIARCIKHGIPITPSKKRMQIDPLFILVGLAALISIIIAYALAAAIENVI